MMRTLIAFVFAAALPLGLVGAHAAERPLLRAEITATSGIVTIGDFFDNPGPYAARPLFRAPDLGLTGTVPADVVMKRAQAMGLANADGNGLRQVTVHRAAIEITPEEQRAMVRDALAERAGVQDPAALEIRYANEPTVLAADPAAAEPIVLSNLTFSNRSGRFNALFTVRLSGRDATVAIAGTAQETVEIVTFARRMARGETVTARDLETTRVPRTTLRGGTVTDPATIVGLAVRRPQAAGRSLDTRDFEEPRIVERREKVIITYRAAGLTLTVQGEAMADGVLGDVIDVLNIQSRRVVQATVTGPGRVAVHPRAARVASLQEAGQ